MAQLNITLNQQEILQMLGDDTGNAFKELLRESLNAVLGAESSEQLGAGRYERTESRTDSRNGTRERPLTTRIGTIVLDVPRHRNAPFKTMVFENYKRSEAALVTTMAEMVVGGVSTAKVGKVMETLCGRSFSKSTVSEACKELDAAVEEFVRRPLDARYLFALVDATYVKARVDHKVVSKALMVAIGLTHDGRKEVLGFGIYDSETTASWRDFLEGLKSRGLKGLKVITSDADEGAISAIGDVFPEAAWQRCQAHFSKNIVEAAPKKLQAGLRSELAEMFNCLDTAAARARRDEIIADYAELAPKAVEKLDSGFEDAMTVMELPRDMRRAVRTTNYIERLNREIKRRTKVIGVFPNPDSIMRLAGACIIEENDRWAAQAKMYYKPSIDELERKEEKLVEIARIQRMMRLAA